MTQKEQEINQSAYVSAVEQFVSEAFVQPKQVGARPASQAGARLSRANWGWLPALSLVSACGLLLIALGNAGSLAGNQHAEAGFWVGLLVLLVPTAIRLISLEPSRKERIGLVLLLGLGLYWVKVMHSPFMFTFADEFFHLQNANAILAGHHLFNQNSILPASVFYPGLETLTTAFVSLSGLSVFTAGLLVIGVARLILFLALYLLTEQVSRSGRVAGIATVFYMCHSNFLFWSAQFSYESLSLPLVLSVLFVVSLRQESVKTDRYIGLTLLALLGIVATVVTHHLSSYFLVGFLCAWTVLHFRLHLFLWKKVIDLFYKNEAKLARRHFKLLPAGRASTWQTLLTDKVKAKQWGPLDLALFALVVVSIWLTFVASSTLGYLSPVLSRAVLSILNVMLGQEGTRVLFHSSSGEVAPIWERIIGLSSVFLSFLGLPFGLWQFWRRYRYHALALLLAGMAVAYFGMLALRLTPAGWETGNRSSAYLFIGLAFVLALGAVQFWLLRRTTWLTRLIFATYLGIIFMGGIIAGWPPALRLAQPYLVRAGDQIIEPQGLTVAKWTEANLGPQHVIVADGSNGGFLLAYGDQAALVDRKYNVDEILNTPTFDNGQINTIKKNEIEYVLIDRRRISNDNMAGYYFNRLDAGKTPDAAWLEPEVYQKLDQEQNVNRILDSGNIVLYDVGAFRGNASVR